MGGPQEAKWPRICSNSKQNQDIDFAHQFLWPAGGIPGLSFQTPDGPWVYTTSNSTQTYHIKRIWGENVLSRVIDAVIAIHTAEALSALALDLVALPLVDEEDLVGVVEPADVLDPRQPRGNQLGVGEEAAEQQEGEDEGGAYRGGDVDVGSQTGYEVPCS